MDLHGVNGNAMDSLHHHHNAAVVEQQHHSHSALYHIPSQPQSLHRYSQQLDQQQLASYDFPPNSSPYPGELDVDPLRLPILPISRELRQGPHQSLLPHPGLPLSHQQQLQHIHPHRSNTCIPSLIPPGMDPAQVDMRTFYPYQPNEVKHRKRTTRSQLKVLEDVYGYDTKPNASLRKKLAEELGMTPRGVQVWFQNRRAKTKSQARKAEQAGVNGKKEDENSPPPKPDTNGPSNGSTNTSESSPSSSSSPASSLSIHRTSISSASSVEDEVSSSPTDALAAADDAQSVSSGSQTVRGESGSSSVSPPSTTGSEVATSPTNANENPESGLSNPSLELDSSIWTQPYPFGQHAADNAVPALDGIPPDAPVDGRNGNGLGELDEAPNGYLNIPEHLNQRRGSLPIIVSPPDAHQQSYVPAVQRSMRGVGVSLGFDPEHRRRSVDTNMLRLSKHPYAFAMGPPSGAPALLGRSISSGSPHMIRHGSMPHVFGEDPLHPGSLEGLSPGHAMHGLPMRRPGLAGRMSMPAVALQRYQQQYQMHIQNQNSGSPPSAFNNPHARYGVPSREVPALIPGPLPSPNFSFGTPSSTSPNMNSSSPNLPPNNASSSPSGPSSAFSLSYPMHLRARRSIVDETDTEDDGSAVSSTYDHASRFGSFTSITGSETSSLTSAWCSDAGSGGSGVGGGELKLEEQPQQQQQQGQQGQSAPEGFDPDIRRASCVSTTGQFVQMFDGLDVNGSNTPQPQNVQTLSGDGQSPNTVNEGGEMTPAVSGDPEAGNSGDGSTLHQASMEFGLGSNEDTDGGNTLLYPTEYQDQSLTKGVHDFASYPLDPLSYNGGYTTDAYSSYAFSAMVDGNGNPVYDTGAIELSHMCVPSNMAMENFAMPGDQFSYS